MLSRAGRSCQFGRTSTPMIPQQLPRGAKDGNGRNGVGEPLDVAWRG
jgi:hypothetical protein